MSPEPRFNPDAQAIWDAFVHAECDEYQVDPRHASLAAALREASQRITSIHIPSPQTPFGLGVTEGMRTGAREAARYLTMIAHELHPGSTLTYKGQPVSSLSKEALIDALAETAAENRRLTQKLGAALDPLPEPLPGSGLSPFPPEHDEWDPVKPGN